MSRKIKEEYENVYFKLLESISICLQRELEYIIRLLNNQNSSDIMLKFIILVKEIHEINPIWSVDSEFGENLKIADQDLKEKRMFILNIKSILMDAYLDEYLKITDTERLEHFIRILEVYYSTSKITQQAQNHPLIYSLIANTFPKLAVWAKKTPENKEWLIAFLEKWVLKELNDVNNVIEEKAQMLSESLSTRTLGDSNTESILPHLSVRIYNELAKDHVDIIDHGLVIKIIWIYRKLFLFLEQFFKKATQVPGVPSVISTEFKSHYKNIYFPFDMEVKQEIADNSFSQITIVYSIKVAAVKMHEFDINFLDEYLKLLDSIITYCKNEELSMIIYEVYECLLVSPKPNSLGVKIDLSLAKKVWLGSCLLKKAVGESSKNLKDRMENIITEFLTTHRLNNTDETMNLYDYAVFFFTNNENKQKIQRAFEASFGGGLFTKLRFILENKDTIEFIQMNSPPIIMRKISEAIMSHFEGILAVSCQQKNSLILRDL